MSGKLPAEYRIGQWASKRTLRPTFTAQVQYYQFQKLILPSRILSSRENEPQRVIKTSKSGHLTDAKLISFMSTTSAAVSSILPQDCLTTLYRPKAFQFVFSYTHWSQLTHSLTKLIPLSRIFLEDLTVYQLFNKFHALYSARRFNTMLEKKNPRHLSPT